MLTGLAATWVWEVVAHEVAKDARLIRELHARLCKPSGEVRVLIEAWLLPTDLGRWTGAVAGSIFALQLLAECVLLHWWFERIA
ncbi:hypothetical protein DY981_23270 [Pseudomonas aeruginosa]|uniref:hypothetical protein n=1 Tax=Pseudomonadaceae TaxID=135621 RepID=UPI000F822B10|nr:MULTISPECIES: hypothetical protein [Pseudomonadaceae]RTV09119.1 hypothetical protein DY981_23270 [Pseudomonas aeruginosa]